MKRTSLQIMILAATAASLLAQDQQFPNQQVQEEDGPSDSSARAVLFLNLLIRELLILR